MNQQEAMEYIRQNHRGALATQMRNGRPQLSLISYALDDDGRIKISVTRSRAKTRNVQRDPRVSMVVLGDDFYQYVVVEGTGRIQEGTPLADLRRIYRKVRGEEHPNWEEFDEAMRRDDRTLLWIEIARLYPLTG